MNKKSVPIIMLFFIIVILSSNVFASSNIDIVSIKTSNQYIVYVKNYEHINFEFAFSDKEDSAIYESAKSDADGIKVLNILTKEYDDRIKKGDLYLFIKNGNEVKSIKVNFENSIDTNSLNYLNNLTKTITVRLSTKEEKITSENGDYSNITISSIVTQNPNEKSYKYNLTKISGAEYENLFNLIKKTNEISDNTSKYDKFKTLTDLNSIYNELLLKVKWTNVENNEILQPKDAKLSDKYVVWLKDSNNNVDIQIMNSFRKEYSGTDEITIKKEIEEVVKLPITFDNIVPIIIAIILILSIIILVIIRIKFKRKNEK